jgi:hypothetical protein
MKYSKIYPYDYIKNISYFNKIYKYYKKNNNIHYILYV